MPDLPKNLGFEYLQKTKIDRNNLGMKRLKISPGQLKKEYPNVKRFPLPPPRLEVYSETANFWETLAKRRSRRKYSSSAISQELLSLLCWSAQGITAQAGKYYFRTAPSAGALYPIETYLGVNKVMDMSPGIYHLNIYDFHLEQLVEGPIGPILADAALGQRFLAESAVVFLWSAILRRNMSKYMHRGLRYIMMDLGHICQNLLLASQALNLSACPVAAFFDDEINDILGLDGKEESILYLASVGQPFKE